MVFILFTLEDFVNSITLEASRHKLILYFYLKKKNEKLEKEIANEPNVKITCLKQYPFVSKFKRLVQSKYILLFKNIHTGIKNSL